MRHEASWLATQCMDIFDIFAVVSSQSVENVLTTSIFCSKFSTSRIISPHLTDLVTSGMKT